MRAPLVLPLALLFQVGCEPMPEPGGVFEAVPAAAQSHTPSAEPDADPLADAELEAEPFFPLEEPVVFHSSELGGSGPELEAVAVAEPPEPEDASEPAAQPLPAAVAPPSLPESLDAPVAEGSAWPLRVVATVPGAQPPRAILGLPGGKELVVSPGSMIPEAGVVVMAVGAKTVDLAEIRPVGDHAVVQDRTLHVLNAQTVEISATP